MVLIHHIERYLTKIGIDMGVDEKLFIQLQYKMDKSILPTTMLPFQQPIQWALILPNLKS